MKSLASKRFAVALIIILNMAAAGFLTPSKALSSCVAPSNAIEAENCRPGNPSSEWDIVGAGDPGIQGFATEISVNAGETVRFKVMTDAADYRLDIYRIGYYGGNGARKVATVLPSATLPQAQPACVNEITTKLTDCGNWAESASWTVPADAVSGVYIAKLVRTDSGGASHIVFVVRDDSGGSDLLFKTSDTTWLAYNSYGLGFIEYPDYGYPSQKATKVSYNRPFLTRATNNGLGAYNWFFQSEYPLIRWLEANGYDVSYFTSLDADRRGTEILEHKALLSVGHDEYWSGQMRTNVEAARAAGVHLAFFSGNESYRKIRWENSIDGSGTPYRTMVCYNESNAPAPVDPAVPPVWTGTWRNPTYSPPLDGGRPENALSGTLFTVSSGPTDLGISLRVPEANGKMRFWRNTAVAALSAGQSATLGDRVVGYEFNEDIDNGYRPAGLMQLSSTTTPVNAKLLGSNVNIGADVYLPGTATHVMTLYRDPGGALVFSAGTVHWSWGLDGVHDNGPSVPDTSMRQATVNLFADMGIQPAALQAGTSPAAASSDKTAPVSTIAYPPPGASFPAGTVITITGTAADSGGGVAGGVEISTDGGITWHPAIGRESWSYVWNSAVVGASVIRSRAVDDNGNLETASPGVSVTITSAAAPSYSIWPATTVPGLVDGGPDGSVELGVKFRSDVDGFVTGIRFYKAATNTGTHTGTLWSAGGTRLATVTFAGETASGWQQMNFTAPVAIAANTVYVASYHANSGHYSADLNYFTAGGMDSPPLHALASGVSGLNGVYAYGATSSFPAQSWNNANYWVDVVVNVPAATLLTLSAAPLPDASLNTPYSAAVTASGGTLPYTWSLAGGALPAGLTLDASTGSISGTAATTGSFSFTVKAADSGDPQQSATMVVGITVTAQSSFTIWPATTVPALVDAGPDSAVELGVKFRADISGHVTGIRFYKSLANTGAHVGNLWTDGGTLLATAAFTGETASGWQQVNFRTPVAITANTVYVVSYHTGSGHYSDDVNYFAARSVDNPPLHAPADGVWGFNGVYAYGASSSFPDKGWNSSNYWVDVVFSTTAPADTTPPAVTGFTVQAGASPFTVAITSLTATDNVAVTGYLVNESASAPSSAAPGWSVDAVTSYSFTTPGNKTLYAWVRDAAGNISAGVSADVAVSLNGPILLVSSKYQPFSAYNAEIIRAEGFNAYGETDVSLLTSDLLAAHDVVILGEMPLTDMQAALLSDWVNSGGKLIAMRPDKKLAGLFGLSDLGYTLSDAYLLVNTSSGPGAGIVDQTIQFHGTADLYALSGATSLAALYTDAATATSLPAVTLNNYGTNGGQAAAFTYDLARSVVYTRQGNPLWSGQERDGLKPIRSNDLYYGAASFDLQPDWVDLNKVDIPQADEQQRLLANVIIRMNQDRKPLPRFWYFPRSLPAVVVMTGDDHGNNGTAGRFDSYRAISPSGCSVDDWECIRGTSYIFTDTPLTAAQALDYSNDGFEVAVHVSTNCSDWTPPMLESFYAAQLNDWLAKYGTLPAPTTHRTHCIVWSDFATQPVVELAHGIRLDTTYYYYPSAWVSDRPGFFTGSGIPMRFADSSGNAVDVFQAATQMTDESGQTFPFTIDTLLDNAIGPEGYYGVFVANMHTDVSASSGSDSIVDSARARGIPVVSSRQLLKWLDGRSTSTFGSLEWNGTTLAFSISASQAAKGLMAMVPVIDGQAVTGITRSGAPAAFETVRIKGIQYARFAALSGMYQVGYAADATPPGVSGFSPLHGESDVSTVPQVVATFNELMDPASVTSGTFELRDPLNTLVSAVVVYDTTAQKAILEPAAPLAASTNYTATIKGGEGGVKDLAGNLLAGDFSWMFSTTATSNGTYSIWPDSVVPGLVDSGPDNPVELGVKFRTDIIGYIRGIRFYKAETNTGLHTANLWTGSGTLLATAPFAGESASGWQEVIFPVSVPVSANTVYVASYHTGAGHYSADLNYFKSSGVDSPPLRALANGVSGFNGVYAYGTTSRFPNQGWNSSNYWVDVVFSAVPAPELSYITVTPGNQRVAIGTSQQFTATGTYADGSSRNLTSQVTWSSTDTGVAAVTTAGVVTASSLGIATISATIDGISGSTNLTATDQIGLLSRDIFLWHVIIADFI